MRAFQTLFLLSLLISFRSDAFDSCAFQFDWSIPPSLSKTLAEGIGIHSEKGFSVLPIPEVALPNARALHSELPDGAYVNLITNPSFIQAKNPKTGKYNRTSLTFSASARDRYWQIADWINRLVNQSLQKKGGKREQVKIISLELRFISEGAGVDEPVVHVDHGYMGAIVELLGAGPLYLDSEGFTRDQVSTEDQYLQLEKEMNKRKNFNQLGEGSILIYSAYDRSQRYIDVKSLWHASPPKQMRAVLLIGFERVES